MDFSVNAFWVSTPCYSLLTKARALKKKKKKPERQVKIKPQADLAGNATEKAATHKLHLQYPILIKQIKKAIPAS